MNTLVEIVASRDHDRGIVYTFRCLDTKVEVLFLNHSIQRAKKWEVSIERVGECLLFPDEVLVGHFGRYIAHKVAGDHLVRAVYEYTGTMPTLITVYVPRTERYLEGGSNYEDKILR